MLNKSLIKLVIISFLVQSLSNLFAGRLEVKNIFHNLANQNVFFIMDYN